MPKKKRKEKPFVRLRHKVWFHIVKPFARLFFFLRYGYRVKGKYRIKKNRPVIVLSNHQANLDPFFVEFSFNTYLYTVASDHMFSSTADRIQNHIFPSIPKRKGSFDIRCALMIKRTIAQGGSILLFPEGNRSYAEFQFPIETPIARFRSYGIPIVLFNLHGGNGVDPRFSHKLRRGKFYGEIKEVFNPEDYEGVSDEDFAQMVRDGLRVYDSDSGEKYKSKVRGEYLERVFFVCPKCGHKETLVSKGANITCTHCGLTVEYTEDLHLRSDDPEFKFTRMLDWYEYQKDWVRNYEVKDDEIIFEDDNVSLEIRNPYNPVEKITKGKITLTKDTL